MIRKKLVATFLTATLCTSLLAGCGGGNEASNTADSSVLRVGFEGMTVPTNWTQDTDAHGAIQITGTEQYLCGFEVDLMKRVCEEAGLTLEPYKYEWDGLMMAVQSNKVDCAISMITPTEERSAQMDFTEPYYSPDLVMVVKKDSPYASAKSLDELSGIKATSMLNTLWYDVIDQIPSASKEAAMESVPVLVVAVNAGTVDGILLDRPTAEGTLISNPELAIVELDEESGFEVPAEQLDVAIAVTKGNEELVGKLNDALEKITDEEKNKMMDAACQNQPLNQ